MGRKVTWSHKGRKMFRGHKPRRITYKGGILRIEANDVAVVKVRDCCYYRVALHRLKYKE